MTNKITTALLLLALSSTSCTYAYEPFVENPQEPAIFKLTQEIQQLKKSTSVDAYGTQGTYIDNLAWLSDLENLVKSVEVEAINNRPNKSSNNGWSATRAPYVSAEYCAYASTMVEERTNKTCVVFIAMDGKGKILDKSYQHNPKNSETYINDKFQQIKEQIAKHEYIQATTAAKQTLVPEIPGNMYASYTYLPFSPDYRTEYCVVKKSIDGSIIYLVVIADRASNKVLFSKKFEKQDPFLEACGTVNTLLLSKQKLTEASFKHL